MSIDKKTEKYIALSEYAPIRALLQSIPHVGAALDTLLFDDARRIKEERLNETIDGLHKAYGAIKAAKLDRKYLQSPEFLQLIESAITRILSEASELKRQYLRNALINSTLLHFSKASKQEIQDLLMRLTVEHIAMLEHFERLLDGNSTRYSTALFQKAKIIEGVLSNLTYKEMRDRLDRLVSLGVITKNTDVDITNNDPEGDPDVVVETIYGTHSVARELLIFIVDP